MGDVMAEYNQQFDSFQEWANKASSWLRRRSEFDPRGARVVCFDTKGRLCRIGGDFMRADKEGAFPVRWLWPDQIAAHGNTHPLFDGKEHNGIPECSGDAA